MEDTSKIEILEAIGTFAEHVDTKFDQIDQRFDRIEQTMVTKDYLEKRLVSFATKEDLVNEVDRFIRLHQKLDVEIVPLRHRTNRIESTIGGA